MNIKRIMYKKRVILSVMTVVGLSMSARLFPMDFFNSRTESINPREFLSLWKKEWSKAGKEFELKKKQKAKKIFWRLLRENDVRGVKHLLSVKDVDINKVDGCKESILLKACAHSVSDEVFKVLLSYCTKDTINRDGLKLKKFKELELKRKKELELKRKKELELKRKKEAKFRKDLVEAIKNCNYKKLSNLLYESKILSKDNINGVSPLLIACYYNNLGMVKFLLENGVKKFINDTNEKDWTSLFYACINGNINIVRLLLENGAFGSINKAIINGETPIIVVVRSKHIKLREKFELCKLLINYGADISKREHKIVGGKRLLNKGSDAFEIAKKYDARDKKDMAGCISKIKCYRVFEELKKRSEGLLYEKIYKEKECPICCNENNKYEILVLHPCGHTCCASCVKNLFFKTENKPHRCPFCNQGIINVEYLKKAKLKTNNK